MAHGPFGCHLKDKCVEQGAERLAKALASLEACRLVLSGVAPGYSHWAGWHVTLPMRDLLPANGPLRPRGEQAFGAALGRDPHVAPCLAAVGRGQNEDGSCRAPAGACDSLLGCV